MSVIRPVYLKKFLETVYPGVDLDSRPFNVQETLEEATRQILSACGPCLHNPPEKIND